MDVFDLHVDSIIEQRLFKYDLTRCHRAGWRGQPFFGHADIPRMHEAGYRSACMGIHYFPWESERGWREMLRQIDYLDTIATEKTGCLRVFTPQDWQNAKSMQRLALAPAVEGAHMLNGKLDRVAILARRGVAYLTMAHFCRNAAVTPSMGRGANSEEGLTSFGRSLIRELNRYGIAVDVAHVNYRGVIDICRESTSPVLCTHTGVKGIYNSIRNISDQEIDAIAATDGTIGIMFAPIFLSGKLRRDSNVVLDHIEYVVRRVGVRHVAIGSDYDGWIPSIPCDQRDCRDIRIIERELYKRNYTSNEIAMILYENALRVLKAAWENRDARVRS